MSKVIEDKIGSTIYARLNSIRMSEVERQRALVALYDAHLLVEAFVWIGKKIEQVRERLFLKPSLKH